MNKPLLKRPHVPEREQGTEEELKNCDILTQEEYDDIQIGPNDPYADFLPDPENDRSDGWD